MPDKIYTAPDGSVYRVEIDGSVTKIKDGHVLSNEPPSKYKITSDGEIYRVENDGSVTYLGNAEEKMPSPPSFPNISHETNKKSHVLDTGKHYKVILESAGKWKLPVVKAIAELINCSLKPAKDLVDNTPAVIIDDIPESKALQIKSEFEKIGAVVSVQPYTSQSNRLTTNHNNQPVNNASNDNQNLNGKGGGCFGVLLLLIFSSAALIANLI